MNQRHMWFMFMVHEIMWNFFICEFVIFTCLVSFTHKISGVKRKVPRVNFTFSHHLYSYVTGFYFTCENAPNVTITIKGKKKTIGCITCEFTVSQIGPHNTASVSGLSLNVNLVLWWFIFTHQKNLCSLKKLEKKRSGKRLWQHNSFPGRKIVFHNVHKIIRVNVLRAMHMSDFPTF